MNTVDKNKVKKMLMSLGVDPSTLGYTYLTDAITIICNKTDERPKTTDIYESIAKEYKSSSPRVQRCMRHAINGAFSRNNAKLFDMFDGLIRYEDGKLTVNTFVYTVGEYLLMNESEG